MYYLHKSEEFGLSREHLERYNRKVSVIIPNYNKMNYLDSCIRSVINQTYENIEIVVVDDCSTDESRELINELSIEYNNVVAVFLPTNGGVCNARNLGAKVSTGDYLTFLDSDDIYINKKKIENEMQMIHSVNDIAFSQWVPLNVDGDITSNKIEKKNIYNNRYAICKILSITRPGYQQLRGYLFPKELFHKVEGYAFPYNFFEDFDFQCRLVLAGKLKYTKEYGEGYRNVPGGLSKQKILNAKEIISIIQDKYYKELHFDQKVYYRVIIWKKQTREKVLIFYSKTKKFLLKLIH